MEKGKKRKLGKRLLLAGLLIISFLMYYGARLRHCGKEIKYGNLRGE